MAYPYTFEDGFIDDRTETERAFDIYVWENGYPANCKVCPFHDACNKEELWWICGDWEDDMGDDL